MAPTANQSHTKQKGNQTYHWCKNHHDKGMWTVHTQQQCQNKKHPNHPEHQKDQVPEPSTLTRTALVTTITNFGDTHDSDEE